MIGDLLPEVTIVVPVRNGERTLADCLTTLRALDYPVERREILVVDNDSTDGTAGIIRSVAVRSVTEPNRGLSHARNRGIEAAGTGLVAFLDADCMVTKGWLRELVRGFEDETVGVAVGEVLAYPPTTPAERYYARRKPLWQLRSLRYPVSPWFLSGNALFHRKVFARVGRFDPRFSGGGCEDIDFAWRFFESNSFRLVYCAKAIAFHRHRTSARGIFRQYRGYGRGQAILSCKYPERIPWGWRSELRAYVDLCRSTVALAAAAIGSGLNGRHPEALSDASLELVRKLGERVGFTAGMLARGDR